MKNINPYERKVYYYETDKMGIMHHSNYIRIFEEARVSFLEQAGLPFSEIESKGIMVPVLHAECAYKKPLIFDESFLVYAVITKFNGVRFNLNYRIISNKTGELAAEGSTSHCFTDMDLKPIRIKSKYPEVYKTFYEYTDSTYTLTQKD